MKYDYDAILTIHNLPTMTPKRRDILVKWLRNEANQLAKEKDLKIYSKRFRALLMK